MVGEVDYRLFRRVSDKPVERAQLSQCPSLMHRPPPPVMAGEGRTYRVVAGEGPPPTTGGESLGNRRADGPVFLPPGFAAPSPPWPVVGGGPAPATTRYAAPAATVRSRLAGRDQAFTGHDAVRGHRRLFQRPRGLPPPGRVRAVAGRHPVQTSPESVPSPVKKPRWACWKLPDHPIPPNPSCKARVLPPIRPYRCPIPHFGQASGWQARQ